MLQYYLEHFGVAVGAIPGGLAAKDKRIDLFGVIVLALVTVLERWLPGNVANRFACIGITPAMRLAAIQWRLTLPEFNT